MRKILVLFTFFCLIFTSCQYFDQKVPIKKQLFEKEMKSIDWQNVDEFPSIDACDSIADTSERQRCFFDYLSSLIQEKLAVDTPAVMNAKSDSIDLKVTVFPDAHLGFETVSKDQDSLSNSVKIDSIIKAKLVDFPKISPAIKRGVPVKSQFVLPVIIKVE
jgi:hypothetical protein